MSSPIPLPGCRHDILGHYLKAMGILRVVSKCAAPEHRDPDAEGWWNPDDAIFYLRSPKYPTMESLVDFFEKNYQPTPVFSPWNTGGGMDEKKIVIFRCAPKSWHDYWQANKEALLAHGFPKPEGDGVPEMPEKPFELKLAENELKPTDDISVIVTIGKQKKPKTTVQISWSDAARTKLFGAMSDQRPNLERCIKFTDSVIKKFIPGKSEFTFDLKDESALSSLAPMAGAEYSVQIKESGKKAVMALLANELASHPDALTSLNLGRDFFADFQADETNGTALLEQFRDKVPDSASQAMDSVFTTRASARPMDSPLFLNRGKAGNSEVFRAFWGFFLSAKVAAENNVKGSLFGLASEDAPPKDGASPFFPDAFKSYNIGSGWVQSDYPIYPLDYVLAVEGAFAMRGGASRTLGANSKRFAAFPFVFDSAEEMVDDENTITGTSSSLWFPLWDRKTTFDELASFITDAQARLSGKEARFSAEFVRAMNSQGVDAGFAGWQEFRFRMKGSKVPWITTGRYIAASNNKAATQLNRALSPLDESCFIDQFDFSRNKKTGEIEKDGPHTVRAEINAAMETAALDPTAHHCMALLESIFKASRQLAISKTFRAKVHGIGTFFDKLPINDWHELLKDLEAIPEFRVARAIASIPGLMLQHDQKRNSKVQPMLGSLLPLAYSFGRWQLEEKSYQAVWTGTDLCHDLTVVLQRRYMDSLKDDQPALRGVHQARLSDVMAFLNHELDDHLIARWIEALSLIGWHFEKKADGRDDDGEAETAKALAAADAAPLDLAEDGESKTSPAIPLAYAALRTLLELECEWQRQNRSAWKKRRSQQPISHLCQRSASSLPVAVSEALRWIGIWGVQNPWGAESRQEKEILSGRYVIRLDPTDLNFTDTLVDPARLAAAVCIPLAWEDQWQLRRAITLPFSA
ncbi:MAG: type I-U CRISPR-associated protein Csx17 [Prosthecobacter sp.]|jgi:CRISPR-associated protein Csx17|uniref:type I-G CRISPR-associated protein Cas8g1/Csx17 n=1 Tax=Prosthecobacter sp. TaxID=1965333 RepID=UPI0019ED7D3B|nr:type I-U CRISPR-associated protein Csx17 [Prosthecobacter sp.]MBE2283334.1 type I-U CRISPR-associated protein Csx17 [Prosthecobacter sp.]